MTGDEEKILAEKEAMLEKARLAVDRAGKMREEVLKRQQEADMAVAEAQKMLEIKAKGMGAAKKGVDDILVQKKKLETEARLAELAAEQAKTAAAEKARLVEVAKSAVLDLELKNQGKFLAQEKVEMEMQLLQKSLTERQQVAAAALKETNEVEAVRQSGLGVVKQTEQEVARAKLAALEAQKAREEAVQERRQLGQELLEMQALMDKKRAEIEERLKRLEGTQGKGGGAGSGKAPEVKAPEVKAVPGKVGQPAASNSAPVPVSVAEVVKPVAEVVKPVAEVVKPVAEVAMVKPVAPIQMRTNPEKAPVEVVAPAVVGNRLGLKFVPVGGGVDFCIWQTRVKDFEVFARATNLKSSLWKGPGFKQTPEHPVVNVSWVEATDFCQWLTDVEHKDGSLAHGQIYRLPTDLEWSRAVGLAEESGKTPEARDMGVADVYPWGNQWPPPAKSGNYTGEETGSDVAIKGYNDGFAWTSPVGSFPPNALGIYDMGGNVWQWCLDGWNNESKAKVLRGGSWYNGALKLSLLSSCRVHASPESSTDNYGFRIVRASKVAKG